MPVQRILTCNPRRSTSSCTPCLQSLMFFALFSSSHARALEEAHASPPLLMIENKKKSASEKNASLSWCSDPRRKRSFCNESDMQRRCDSPSIKLHGEWGQKATKPTEDTGPWGRPPPACALLLKRRCASADSDGCHHEPGRGEEATGVNHASSCHPGLPRFRHVDHEVPALAQGRECDFPSSLSFGERHRPDRTTRFAPCCLLVLPR